MSRPATGRVKIIGLDPGLAATGIGIIQGTGSQVAGYAYGTIRTPARRPLPERLDRIHRRLTGVLAEEAPDLMVVEDVFSLDRYPRSGITLGKVIGVILLAGAQCALPVAEVAVREAKHVLTGNGNASKAQLEGAVRRTLGLTQPIRPDHASDALGLALVGLFRYGRLRAAGPSPVAAGRDPAAIR